MQTSFATFSTEALHTPASKYTVTGSFESFGVWMGEIPSPMKRSAK